MDTIIVSPKTKAEIKLLTDLLHQMKIPAKVLTDVERENIGLDVLMKKAERTKKAAKANLPKTLTDTDRSPYDPKFVAKIRKGDEDIKNGKCVKIAIQDLWK